MSPGRPEFSVSRRRNIYEIPMIDNVTHKYSTGFLFSAGQR